MDGMQSLRNLGPVLSMGGVKSSLFESVPDYKGEVAAAPMTKGFNIAPVIEAKQEDRSSESDSLLKVPEEVDLSGGEQPVSELIREFPTEANKAIKTDRSNSEIKQLVFNGEKIRT